VILNPAPLSSSKYHQMVTVLGFHEADISGTLFYIGNYGHMSELPVTAGVNDQSD
jgi:hypothetical protein